MLTKKIYFPQQNYDIDYRAIFNGPACSTLEADTHTSITIGGSDVPFSPPSSRIGRRDGDGRASPRAGLCERSRVAQRSGHRSQQHFLKTRSRASSDRAVLCNVCLCAVTASNERRSPALPRSCPRSTRSSDPTLLVCLNHSIERSADGGGDADPRSHGAVGDGTRR